MRRTVAEVYGILTRREEYFRAHGIDSIATFRRTRARGRDLAADQPWGDVFLVIDGWGNFRTDYEALEQVVADIAARGLGYGIHLVITASRSMEVRAALKDQLLNRLELRLGDAMDSEFDRKVAANVPAGVPGRGLTPEKLHFMAAVPRIDGIELRQRPRPRRRPRCAAEVDAPLDGAARARRYGCCRAAAGRASCRRATTSPERGIAFGIDENNLEPVFVDFEPRPVLPDLRRERVRQVEPAAAAHQAAHRAVRRATGASSFVVDNRRSLLDVDPGGAPGGVHPRCPNHMEHHMDALARPHEAPHADGRRHAAAAARPQLVARPDGVRRSSTTTTWSPRRAATRWRP